MEIKHREGRRSGLPVVLFTISMVERSSQRWHQGLWPVTKGRGKNSLVPTVGVVRMVVCCLLWVRGVLVSG
jgi:hypothetical protein